MVRIAGFALFIKFLDFFSSYFISVNNGTNLASVTDMSEVYNRLFYSMIALTIANLLLSLFLIIKADWIANKLVKVDNNIAFDLSVKNVMRIIIATIGIIYCARTLYFLPKNIEVFITWLKLDSDYNYNMSLGPGLLSSAIKAIIGVIFLFKSEQLASFALKRI